MRNRWITCALLLPWTASGLAQAQSASCGDRRPASCADGAQKTLDAEESIAFIVENKKKTKSTETFVKIVTIEEIERKTGLRFLSPLAATQRRAAITTKADAI